MEDLAGLRAAGLIPSRATVELCTSVSTWAEGPVWMPELGCLRWSDIPANRICEFVPATGETRVYAEKVEFTNGRVLDRDGSVLQCSHGRRRVERDRAGVVEPLVSTWGTARFNSPNDVVVSADGAVWFTDPPYGITEAREGHPGEREYGDHFVFRVSPEDGRVHPVVTDVEEPNGLAFSPDESLLYVSDSSSVRRPAGVGNRSIRVYDVQQRHRCKNGRVFALLAEADGFSDGIAVDDRGNVWSSSGVGVIVYAPNGTEVGRVPVPEVTGNVCFGGPDGHDLYIAATTSIYRIKTLVRDASTAWRARLNSPRP